MLEDLWDATGGNSSQARTIINFSTQPVWLYSDVSDYSVPPDPLQTDFKYPKGKQLADPTGRAMASYFADIVAWIRYGKHNGPRYPIDHDEFLNEPNACRGQTIEDYTLYFDRFVQAVRGGLPEGEKDLTYVGLALAGNRLDWLVPFLNESTHLPGTFDAVQKGLVSFHHYAKPSSRMDPVAFESIFDSADDWIEDFVVPAVRARALLSPTTRFDANELGVVLPNDDDPNAPQFPLVYWNAAAALFAYEYARLAKAGVEVVGMSQWAGNPPMTIAGMKASNQHPGVSIMNYTTGEGTARYWTLKLMLEAFQPGDRLVRTTVATSPMCGVMDPGLDAGNYSGVTLQCAGPGATISSIDFAAFGTPYGTCGDYHHNASCDASNATEVAEHLCLGKASCCVPSYPQLGDPCFGSVKRLIVQARCSDGQGGVAHPGPSPYFAQGFAPAPGAHGLKGKRRLLVVNTNAGPIQVDLSGVFGSEQMHKGGIAALVVDEATGFGPARKQPIAGNESLPLSAFAVAVAFEET